MRCVEHYSGSSTLDPFLRVLQISEPESDFQKESRRRSRATCPASEFQAASPSSAKPSLRNTAMEETRFVPPTCITGTPSLPLRAAYRRRSGQVAEHLAGERHRNCRLALQLSQNFCPDDWIYSLVSNYIDTNKCRLNVPTCQQFSGLINRHNYLQRGTTNDNRRRKHDRRKPGRPRKFEQGRNETAVRVRPKTYAVLKAESDSNRRSVSEESKPDSEESSFSESLQDIRRDIKDVSTNIQKLTAANLTTVAAGHHRGQPDIEERDVIARQGLNAHRRTRESTSPQRRNDRARRVFDALAKTHFTIGNSGAVQGSGTVNTDKDNIQPLQRISHQVGVQIKNRGCF